MKNNPIMVTQQQANELNALIDDFKVKLDNSETKEETAKIHHNIYESLDEIGLLIEDASIKKTQEMGVKYGNNTLCLISGRTTNTIFIRPIALFINSIGWVFWIIYKILTIEPNESNIANLFKNLHTLFLFILPTKINSPTENRNIHFGSFIGIGGFHWDEPLEDGSPWYGKGWINTVGLNGIKNWSGTMRGDVLYSNLLGGIYDTSQHYEYYPAVTGFVGYGYSVGEELFYIGTALMANVVIKEY